MDFYLKIKSMSEDEIKELIDKTIPILELNSEDEDTIGYYSDINPVEYNLTAKEFDYNFQANFCNKGFVKKNTKIVYGVYFAYFSGAKNLGAYYYLDTYDYLYEFSNYIKNKEVENEYMLFDYLLKYLNRYFGYDFNNFRREDMFSLISNTNDRFYKPTKEHYFTTIRDNNNAECSEYSIIANNILSLFGFKSYVMIGFLSNYEGDFAHAFNLVSYNEKETGEDVNLLIDFSLEVKTIDYKDNIIALNPFIEEIEEINDNLIKKYLQKEYVFDFLEYNYYYINNHAYKLVDEEQRKYFIEDNYIVKEYKKIL